ncbi:response regulator [Nocardioides psychrotolerans]|nr:response regulator [Nocardioides psychrotolerans]
MTAPMPLVLVVDDDDSIREIAQLSLELVGGWQVLAAGGGASALEQAAEHRPHAILLDVMMPVMDGIETFHRLRADERTQHIPVILVTAKRQADEHQVWDGLPIAGVIPKPFDPMTLAQQVSALLDW